MQLEFKVTGQILKRTDNQIIVSNSKNYLTAHFDLPEDFTGIITAHFMIIENKIEKDYPMILDETRICKIPYGQNDVIKPLNFTVSLSSYDAVNEVFIPTTLETVTITKSGVPTEILPLPDGTINTYADFERLHGEVITKSLEVKDLVVKNPYIGEDLHWYVWYSEFNDYMDTGILATGSGDASGTGIDGKSAYQIAVDNGFVGTVEEWLVGLVGEDGYTPIKGTDYFDGVNGYTPIKGTDYFDGVNGVDGTNGIDGITPVKDVDYFDGADGYTPVKGVDYFDGLAGTGIVNQRTSTELLLWAGTNDQHLALGTYDSNTVYLISG